MFVLGGGNLHDGTSRAEVTAEGDERAGVVQGVVERADEVVVDVGIQLRSRDDFLAESAACDGHGGEFEEGLELDEQGGHTARVVEVGHVVRARGLEVDEEGSGAADGIDGVERDSTGDEGVAVGDGEEVDDGVGGAADRLEDGDGVDEGFPREDGLGTELSLGELNGVGAG